MVSTDAHTRGGPLPFMTFSPSLILAPSFLGEMVTLSHLLGFIFFKICIYFRERDERRGRKEKHQWEKQRAASCTPLPAMEPATWAYMLIQKIKLATFCCMGRCSTKWATPARHAWLHFTLRLPLTPLEVPAQKSTCPFSALSPCYKPCTFWASTFRWNCERRHLTLSLIQELLL